MDTWVVDKTEVGVLKRTGKRTKKKKKNLQQTNRENQRKTGGDIVVEDKQIDS